MQRHQDAAVSQSDVQRIVAGFFSGDFLVADAGSVVVALSIQDPAVGFQDLDGLGGIIGIGVQSFREQLAAERETISCSAGVVLCSRDEMLLSRWIEYADRALYQARENRKGCCCVFQVDGTDAK